MIHTVLVIIHFVFDWILQPREIATSKKKELSSLLIHIMMLAPSYILIIFLFRHYFIISESGGAGFVFSNMFSHMLIDWFLPQGTSERSMINWTAIDQILHLSILFLTFNYFFIY